MTKCQNALFSIQSRLLPSTGGSHLTGEKKKPGKDLPEPFFLYFCNRYAPVPTLQDAIHPTIRTGKETQTYITTRDVEPQTAQQASA